MISRARLLDGMLGIRIPFFNGFTDLYSSSPGQSWPPWCSSCWRFARDQPTRDLPELDLDIARLTKENGE